eukprot:9484507-Pyramimonas_sp.AAC.2
MQDGQLLGVIGRHGTVIIDVVDGLALDDLLEGTFRKLAGEVRSWEKVCHGTSDVVERPVLRGRDALRRKAAGRLERESPSRLTARQGIERCHGSFHQLFRSRLPAPPPGQVTGATSTLRHLRKA